MKKLLTVMLALLLLAGCARREGATRTDQLQQRYADLASYRAEVSLDLPREDETLHYALSVEGKDGDARVTVREPEMLAGITAELSGEDLALTYDGMTLDALSLSPNVSAVNAVPLILRAAAQGYMRAENREKLGEEETLRLELELEHAGEMLGCTAWFAADDTLRRAELSADGKIILAAEFTNFEFGDILLETKG